MERIVLSFNENGFKQRMSEIDTLIRVLNEFSKKFKRLEIGDFSRDFWNALIAGESVALDKAGDIVEQKLVNAGLSQSSNIVHDAVESVKDKLYKILCNSGIDLTHHIRVNGGFVKVENGVFTYLNNIDEVRAKVIRMNEDAIETKEGIKLYEFHQQMASGLQRVFSVLNLKPQEIDMNSIFDFSGKEITTIPMKYDYLAAQEIAAKNPQAS